MIKRHLWLILPLFLAGCVAASSGGSTPQGDTVPPGTEPRGSSEKSVEEIPVEQVAEATDPPTLEPVLAELEDYGPAPELLNTVWLNVDGPLRLADLKGQVVLLDMWTFG